MDVTNPYDVIAAAFPDEQGAERALAALQVAERADLLDIENAAVIVKDERGRLTFTETEDPTFWQGMGRGVVLGGLVGLLFPGLSIIANALKVGVSGAFTDRLRDTGFEDDDIRDLAAQLAPGTSMILAIVRYEVSQELVAFLGEEAAHIARTGLSNEGARLLRG